MNVSSCAFKQCEAPVTFKWTRRASMATRVILVHSALVVMETMLFVTSLAMKDIKAKAAWTLWLGDWPLDRQMAGKRDRKWSIDYCSAASADPGGHWCISGATDGISASQEREQSEGAHKDKQVWWSFTFNQTLCWVSQRFSLFTNVLSLDRKTMKEREVMLERLLK